MEEKYEYEYEEVEETKPESGAPKVFAILGMVLGIVSIVMAGIGILIAMLTTYDASMDEIMLESTFTMASILPAMAAEIALPGIIFSAIGKKSILNGGKAKIGLILSIIAIVISVIGIAIAFVNYVSFLYTIM